METTEQLGRHELKTWPEYFAAVASGRKTFEVRKADRDFREGDTLILREYLPSFAGPANGYLTGATIEATVTYVLQGGQCGIEAGYVVLGLGGARRSPVRR